MSIKEILSKAVIKKKDGEALNFRNLQDTKIGLYFSAHWCPPCRRFTPLLTEKYNQIKEAGHKFEIIFVSSDGSEDEASDYYADMPWTMLSFEDQETKEAIDKLYDIRGIPSLVLLDEDTNFITDEGTEAIMTYSFENIKNFATEKKLAEEKKAAELAALKLNFSWNSVFDESSIVDKDLKPVALSSLEGKIVGLYFSAHWCPPCRGFTPKLAEKFEELVESGKNFEIIFISSDRDENSAKEYFSEMPWKMLSYSLREKKALLSELFDINGIPSLVLLDEKASLITLSGRQALFDVPFEKIQDFEEEKKRKAELEKIKFASYPDSIKFENHEHELVKLISVYRGQYGCDICGTGGEGYVYHCEECGFDAHPCCVVKDE